MVLHTLGEAIGVIQLSEFDNWDQLFTDSTSVQRLGIQGLIITAYDCRDGTTNKCVLGGGGIVLENGETAEAVCDSIKSTILNSGQHLNGISKVVKDLYPD